MQPSPGSVEPRLKPQFGFFAAVSTGLAAILGAGIFAVIAPAARIAGPALLISLVLAAFVAFCNALSSTQLAAAFPRTGGTYEFGRRMIGPWSGYSAGWMFLVANTVGPGAIAIAFGGYLHDAGLPLPIPVIAVVAVMAMTLLNALGIRRSVRITKALVVLSIVTLLLIVALGLPGARASHLAPFAPHGFGGVLQATALLFFAYTGYSRIATLVEEVRDPARTIPRATVVALGSATIIYLLVATTALLVLGATRLASSASPLEDTMLVVGSAAGVGIAAVGALSTTFNEGLSDLLGVSRVAFAMGRGSDLPRPFVRLDSEQNPRVAAVAVGGVSLLVAAFLPFEFAIAISSFGILLYYTVTNVSCLRLPKEQRMFPRALALAGLVGCVGLAFSLPIRDVAAGLVILSAGILYRLVARRGAGDAGDPHGPVEARAGAVLLR